MLYNRLTTTRYTMLKGRTYDLQQLSEEDLRYLLLRGTHHIAISQQGLKKPLFTAAEIVPLVANAETQDEASRYAALSSAASVRNAWQKRMQQP